MGWAQLGRSSAPRDVSAEAARAAGPEGWLPGLAVGVGRWQGAWPGLRTRGAGVRPALLAAWQQFSGSQAGSRGARASGRPAAGLAASPWHWNLLGKRSRRQPTSPKHARLDAD